ncbi:MAG: hypothetical protein K2W96_01960, partial [Gemmataceae bacterium]|nr:hypothetical protein [Gemmataceae bacterium]
DLRAHRLVSAVKRVTLLDRLPARLPVTAEHRLVSAGELRRRFRDLPQAVANGDELAGMLRADVLPSRLLLPQPRLRAGLDPSAYLRALCERGLRERGLSGPKPRERLEKELAIIEGNGLAGYFLVVRDIAGHARKLGRTMALRGSAGNSLACYLLGITDVDPLRFGLELERFLHPGRRDLPDIDLDFDWKVRDGIIDWAFGRFGPERVARISSHLTFQPRSAFREAAKAHGLSNDQVGELLLSLDDRLDGLLLSGGVPRPPRSFPLEAERWPRLVEDARLLLGRPSHLSLHPGGIVVAPGPVADHAPLQWAAKGVVMTQYDKDAVEAVGLVKIDLLGNRALSAVDEARGHAGAVPPATDCAADPATLRLLRTGDTLGITQLESPAMRHLLMQMKPRGLDDVIQSLALLRPGAASIGMKECFIRRRAGLEAAPLAHPMLAVLLGETHGLTIYEDDSLTLLQALAGMDAAEADRFRKRVSKHSTPEEEEGLRREFMARCAAQGYPPAELGELWAQMAKFNRYSFCKSHSVSYGLIAWQAAWLKAHHPLAFWTAALNNAQGSYPTRVYVEAIKRAGFRVLPPCLNRSRREFWPEDGGIRVGFDSIAGLPEAVREGIVTARRRDGPYASLADLRRRVAIGPEALSSLVRLGAADFTGKSRPALFLEAEAKPMAELFAYDPAEGWTPPDDPPERRWRDEWRLLGFVTERRLWDLFGPKTGDGRVVSSADLARHAGKTVRVQGLVATARLTHTEAGRPLQFVTLEDGEGLAEVSVFDGTCAPVPYLTMGPYTAWGTVEDRHGALSITARRLERA